MSSLILIQLFGIFLHALQVCLLYLTFWWPSSSFTSKAVLGLVEDSDVDELALEDNVVHESALELR